MPAMNRLGDAVWWVSAQVILLVVCVPFLWRAFWTQVHFEPTDEAVTQAYAHHPELATAIVAILAAVVGGLVQILMKAPMRRRLICLLVTSGTVAALLAGGAVATAARLPTTGAIRATVDAVSAAENVTPLPLNVIDQESDPGYPRIVRKWQYGKTFLRSDLAVADSVLGDACSAIQAVAPIGLGWREEVNQTNYCSYVRTVGHVRLHYSASLTPGALAHGQAQSETVVVYLEGDIASPSNL